MQIDLSGKLAVVTGGAGQLARAMCRSLADCGADVVIAYHHSHEKALELEQVIRAKGARAAALRADVTDKVSLEGLRQQILERMGRSPDIIVNNAVAQYKWVHVLEQDAADYESQFRTCVLHNVLMAQVFVPDMVSRRWGRVIAINTECAMQTFPTQSAYVAGKRGMDGVLRVLAREIGPSQVTVNQVAPGWMISDDSPAADDQHSYTDKVPLRRRGTDQDIANLVVFLASDLANFISGQYISVSGGNVMPAI